MPTGLQTMNSLERRSLPRLSGLAFVLRCEDIWQRSLSLVPYAIILGVNAYVRAGVIGEKIPQPIRSGMRNLSTVLLPVPILTGSKPVLSRPSWRCSRCDGPKTIGANPVCDECRYEDEAQVMLRELE